MRKIKRAVAGTRQSLKNEEWIKKKRREKKKKKRLVDSVLFLSK